MEGARADPSANIRAHVADITRGRSAEVASDETAALVEDPERLRRRLALQPDRVVGSRIFIRCSSAFARVKNRSRELQREAWARARGAAHVALASARKPPRPLRSARGARAVDGPAADRVHGGAVACRRRHAALEAIAAAYAHASGGAGTTGGANTSVDTFRAIVKREKLTKRHAVMKKIQKRWPAVVTAATS